MAFPRCVRGWTTLCGGISSRAVPPRGLTVFNLIRTAVSTIWPKTTMNSSTNKQIHDFAYFDKYYAVLMLKLIVLCMSFIKGCYLVNSIKILLNAVLKSITYCAHIFTCYRPVTSFLLRVVPVPPPSFPFSPPLLSSPRLSPIPSLPLLSLPLPLKSS